MDYEHATAVRGNRAGVGSIAAAPATVASTLDAISSATKRLYEMLDRAHRLANLVAGSPGPETGSTEVGRQSPSNDGLVGRLESTAQELHWLLSMIEDDLARTERGFGG